MPVRAPSLAIVVSACLGVGCGNDDEATTAAPSGIEQQAAGGPSSSEYIARADPICAQVKRSIDIARTKFHHGDLDAGEEGELTAFVEDKIVPLYRSEVVALRKLPTPAADRGQIDKMLAATEKATEQLADDPSQIGPRAGSPLFDPANELARDYGLAVCVAPE